MNGDTRFFDEVARNWDSMVKHDATKINRLLSLLPFGENSRILDVGCGTGVLVPYLLERLPGGQIVEMDISQNMLDVAAGKYKDERISFVCGDGADENIEIGAFDAVIAYCMFPHFKDKKVAIGALTRRLNSGGIFGILHPMSLEALNNMHSRSEDESVRDDIMPQMSDLKAWLCQNGCEIINVLDDDEFFAVAAKKL